MSTPCQRKTSSVRPRPEARRPLTKSDDSGPPGRATARQEARPPTLYPLASATGEEFSVGVFAGTYTVGSAMFPLRLQLGTPSLDGAPGDMKETPSQGRRQEIVMVN